MKIHRKNLSREQFNEECHKIYRKSSKDDIQDFINRIKKENIPSDEKISLGEDEKP